MNRLLLSAVLVASLAALPACKKDKPAETDAPAETPETDTAGTPEAPGDAKPAEPAEPEMPLVPAGVSHVDNPKWEDKETPTNMPEFDPAKAKTGAEGALTALETAKKAACLGDKNSVVQIDVANSRIGYVSYKNGELPVAGHFKTFQGFGSQGGAFHFWIDPLSLSSGDPVRDARLLKFFFELENDGHGIFSFKGNHMPTLPTEVGQTAQVRLDGDLALHGKSAVIRIPYDVTRVEDGWEAKLSSDQILLQFAPFGLVEPLKALIEQCNHKQMGSAAKLDITLKLVPGCTE